MYTEDQKAYILSKIKDMRWEVIPDSLKKFWLEWRQKNESND